MKETQKENSTNIIYQLLEEKLEMEDAARKVKIDGSHRDLGFWSQFLKTG